MEAYQIFKFNNQQVIVIEDSYLEKYNLTSLAKDNYGSYHIVSLQEAEAAGVKDDEVSYPEDEDLDGGEEIGIYECLDSNYGIPYLQRICTQFWHDETTTYYNYGIDYDNREPYKGGKLADLMEKIKAPSHPTTFDIKELASLKQEYEAGISYDVPASKRICSFEQAFNKVNGEDYNEWKEEAEKIATAAAEPLTEEETSEANQIFEETLSENTPIDWKWVRHLQRQNTQSEMFDWAYGNCQSFAERTTSDKVLRKAASLLLDYLK